MDETKVRLAKCFSAVFPELASEEIPHADPHTVGHWDSLATVTLLALIQEEFGASLDFGKLGETISFGRILAYLQGERGTGDDA
jgi:acyl carrier protein